MRKLSVYSGDAFTFHQDVAKSKYITQNNPGLKARLAALEPIVKPLFDQYDAQFLTNNLASLNAHQLSDQQRKDLKTLYSYNSKPLQELKVKVTTIENNRALNTCQCCTIGEVGSFDHLIPQDEFREYIVNPKNLFPCCMKCNQIKNSNWRTGLVRRYLNLYLDDLPTSQYLFVDLQVDGNGNVETQFELRNINGIPGTVFSLIRSHYTLLNLCERFTENDEETITYISNQISAAAATNVSLNDTITQIKTVSRANMRKFGNNYWKSILEISLADNAAFANYYYTL